MTGRADKLDILGLAPALGRLIRYYLLRPGARPHQRALQRTLDLGSASVQRELERLQQLGVLEAQDEGRKTLYTVIDDAPTWGALAELARTSTDPIPLLRDALVDVEGVRVAFVFGSFARGEEQEESDIDLFVLEGDGFDRARFYHRLSEVTLLVDREVNAVRYTADALRKRVGDVSHPGCGFTRRVLKGPKEWLAGDSGPLLPIAAAAGLQADEIDRQAA